MAITGHIHFRDLRRLLELHQVTTSPAADTAVDVWAKIIAYPSLTYWTASSVGIVILLPDGFEDAEWREWYFVYGGLNYYLFQYWIIEDEHTSGQFVFIEGRSPSFSSVQIALSDLETYDSDAAAAAAGLSVGDFYRAGSGHDRADFGSITSVLE